MEIFRSCPNIFDNASDDCLVIDAEVTIILSDRGDTFRG